MTHEKENPAQKSCQFCGRICKNQKSLKQHEIRCLQNPNALIVKFPNISEEIKQKRQAAARKAIKERLQKGLYSEKQEFTCQFCGKVWLTTKSGCGCHEVHCYSNPTRKPGSYLGRKRTEEEKRKISEGQKLAHKEGRNSSWIGRRKRSFAEQYWFNLFTKELGEDSFENNFPVKTENAAYFLDFAWPERKLYFEVDGETHFTEEGKQHDLIRTSFLQKSGWILIGRCRWSEYQKLTKDQKIKYFQEIEKLLK